MKTARQQTQEIQAQIDAAEQYMHNQELDLQHALAEHNALVAHLNEPYFRSLMEAHRG